VSGYPGTPSEVVSTPDSTPAAAARASVRLRYRARAYWATPAGKAIVGGTILALAIRLFTLTRPGFLTSVNEYDDGVYLGSAIRLLQGAMPYHDYAFVQPPGIILIAVPAAIVAKLTASSAAGLAIARIMTVLASAACIPLVGNLVRYRGALVTAVTCGALAIYPDDITTAHTLLLEPWMNLLVLLGANAAFRRGHLARPRRLLWAGVAIGAAGAVKYWAVAPAAVLLVFCLLVVPERTQRIRGYIAGLVAGFAIPILPFVIGAPMTFLRSTLLYQATREGSTVPLSLRLAHLTGLIDFLGKHSGRLDLLAGSNSMFASGSTANTSSSNAGLLPFAVTAIIIAIIAVAYAWNPRRPSPLEWFALVTMCLASLAMLVYSAFFYHYPDWAAPWAAIVVGCAAGLLAGEHRLKRGLMYGAAAVIALGAIFEVYELGGLGVGTTTPVSQYIPAGACVVTDEVSLTISSDRFTASKRDCPDVIDSLATTLVMSGGKSIQGGAIDMPKVVAAWQQILGKADYVWVSTNSDRRIPWVQKPDPSPLWIWFTQHFTPVTGHTYLGQLFKREP
jgi:alpha-1,2-mannosyltransferase